MDYVPEANFVKERRDIDAVGDEQIHARERRDVDDRVDPDGDLAVAAHQGREPLHDGLLLVFLRDNPRERKRPNEK